MCGQTSTESLTLFPYNVDKGKAQAVFFANFTYFSVTKTTEYYNETYFQYGAIIGLGYPNS